MSYRKSIFNAGLKRIKPTFFLKKAVVFVLTALLVVAPTNFFGIKASAFEASGKCGDNVYWSFDDETGTLTFSGEGDMYDYCYYDVWTDLFDSPFAESSDVKNVIIGQGITGIGSGMFYVCDSLESVTVPEGLERIGMFAFYNCESLTQIDLPDSITSIGIYAFDETGCINEPMNWENNVMYLGNHLIKARTSLTGSYTVKSGTKSIAGYAFRYCGRITEITIPDSVMGIGMGAFFGCNGLTGMTVPFVGEKSDQTGETFFGIIFRWVEYDCDYDGYTYNSINVPNSLRHLTVTGGQSIGDYAFYGCENVTEVELSYGITSIGKEAFSGCTSLESIFIPHSVTQIDADAFDSGSAVTFTCTEDSEAYEYAVQKGIGVSAYDFDAFVEQNVRSANAEVSVEEGVITLTPVDESLQISLYPSLKDLTAIAFSDLSGGAKISRNGTLYSKDRGTASFSVLGKEYTVVFDFPAQAKPIGELIRTANADVSVEDGTITLTLKDGETQINFYPSLKDGTALVFENFTGDVRTSKNGTVYTRNNGTASFTAGGVDYTVIFEGFPVEEKTVADLIRTANATVSVEGSTITLTAINALSHISLYPKTTDGDDVAFSDTNGVGFSRNGTCYAKTDATCQITVGAQTYTVIFAF